LLFLFLGPTIIGAIVEGRIEDKKKAKWKAQDQRRALGEAKNVKSMDR
jgi:hypothetical protein